MVNLRIGNDSLKALRYTFKSYLYTSLGHIVRLIDLSFNLLAVMKTSGGSTDSMNMLHVFVNDRAI